MSCSNKIVIGSLLALCSCQRVSEQIEPQIDYCVQDRYLKQLPSAFAPLSASEERTGWGHEYLIGIGFAHELDLYQAITSFKRAEILIPKGEPRLLEIQYEILFCYYLAKKYGDVVETFEKGKLPYVQADFPTYTDLLVMLYEAYGKLGECERQEQIRSLLEADSPEVEQRVSLYTLLSQADLPAVEQASNTYPVLEELLCSYSAEKKSVSRAQSLNALLPGAGYLYLGQNQSAITAFLLNGLFIAASAISFERHNPAAGAIFASFEAGWYFGGIYGAGEEAKFYNERLYEQKVTPFMNQEELFPIFSLSHAF